MEENVEYDVAHYPEGLNAIFDADASVLEREFAGTCGFFEDAESRDIAAHADAIVQELGELTLQILARDWNLCRKVC